MFFHLIHFPRRKEFAIGKVFKAIFIATYACKFFNMAIPGGDVIITNWPFHCKAIPHWCIKIKMAPALYLSCP